MNNPYLVLRTALVDRLNEIEDLIVTLQIDPDTQYRQTVGVCLRGSNLIDVYENSRGTDNVPQTGTYQKETLFFELEVRYLTVTDDSQVWEMQNNIVDKVSGYQPYTGTIANTHQALSSFYLTGARVEDANENGEIFGRISVECWLLRLMGTAPNFLKNNG